MKKIYLAIASLAALSFASCTNDDAIEGAQNVASENTLCITASLGDAGSRLAIDKNLEMQTWSEGDYLVDNKGNEYKMKNGAGGVEANFEGPAPTEDCTLKFTVKNVNKTDNPKQATIDDKAHLDGCLAVYSNDVEVKKDQTTLTPASGLKFYNDLSIADVTIKLPEKYFGGEARAKYVDKVTLRLGRALDDYVLEYGDEAKLVGDENAGNDATLTLKAYIPVIYDPTVGITLIDDDITCTVAFKPETEGADPVKFEVKALGVNKVYHQGYTYEFDFSEFDVWALAANGSMFEDYLAYGKSVKNIKLMSDCTVSDKQITLPAVNIDLNGQELKTSKGFKVSEGGTEAGLAKVNIFSSAKEKGETVKGKVTVTGNGTETFIIDAKYVDFSLTDVTMTENNCKCKSFITGNASNDNINITNCYISGQGREGYLISEAREADWFGLLHQNSGTMDNHKKNNSWIIDNSEIYSTGQNDNIRYNASAIYMESYPDENNNVTIKNSSVVQGKNTVKLKATNIDVINSTIHATTGDQYITDGLAYGYAINILKNVGLSPSYSGKITTSGSTIKNNDGGGIAIAIESWSWLNNVDVSGVQNDVKISYSNSK